MEDIEKVETPVAVDGQPEAVEEKVEPTEPVEEELDFSKMEPAVRKRPADYIAERRARRAERPADGSGEPEEVPDLSPKAQEALNRKIQEGLDPIVKVFVDDRNDRELSDVLARRPEWKRYAPLAKKYMSTPGWDAVPVEAIFKQIDYDYAESRGAEAARERLEKGGVRSGGDARRTVERKGGKITAEDVMKMSPAQAQDLQSRLARGESVQT